MKKYDKKQCVQCETLMIVTDSDLCYNCNKNLFFDLKDLSKKPSVISDKKFQEWMVKYGDKDYPMFVNGFFNEKPETLLTDKKFLVHEYIDDVNNALIEGVGFRDFRDISLEDL